MRRLIVVNALIFAVLAAAVALAYYGYSYTAEVASRERALQSLRDLADEKVTNIESLIANDDLKVLSGVRLDQVDKLNEQAKSHVSIAGIFVLDEHLAVVPDGSITVGNRDAKESIALRDWYLAKVIPKLGLARLDLGKRYHHYGRGPHDEPYLLSYARKQQAGRTYYVVIEDDVNHFVFNLFPQFFLGSTNHLYQVVDERGTFRSGVPYSYDAEGLAVSVKFTDTLDEWELRISESDPPAVERELRRKRIVDSLLIGGAVTVILAGLAFLAIAIRRERRANELKSDFISNVSHELKTPLSIISMFGEMLANGRTKSPEQATEYAEIIWRESVRLGRLIDNVLDFAKIERGAVYEFAEADVGEVVERAIDLANRRLANAEMTLSADIEPELPIVQLDANAFTLAVLNLIDNAIKYAADGKKIELALKRAGERIVLTVRDFGPGIDTEEQERIFERFYRAKAMRLKPIRGSGIGLALVQHIARAHGGDVTVTSTPGAGSTFELWIPV